MTEPGSVIAGRYELIEPLGRGGMAEVFRALDRRLDRDVAVKLLHATRAAEEEVVRKFRREARTAAQLNHPNVVSVHDTGTDAGAHYIVMELIEGKTLADVLDAEGPLPVSRALEIMRQICAALAAAHARGLVHRDVKPANIMFAPDGTVKVTDFGLARAVAASTVSATVYGSAPYIAPEQARGVEVDTRADLYAAGCVLHTMLTGEPPFAGDSPLAIVSQHLHAPARRPSERRPEVTAGLDAVVLHALGKDPGERYQTIEELRADLDRVGSGAPPLHAPALPAFAGELDATRLLVEDETVLMAPPLGLDDDGASTGPPAATPPPTAGAPSGTSEQTVITRRPRRARRALGSLLLAVALIGAGVVAGLLLTQDDPTEPALTPNVRAQSPSPTPTPTPTPSPSPSPTPTPLPTPTSILDAELQYLRVVEEGRQQGQVSDTAAEELLKKREDAVKEAREGKFSQAAKKLREAREKLAEFVDDGAVTMDRADLISTAIDHFERLLRRQGSNDDEDD